MASIDKLSKSYNYTLANNILGKIKFTAFVIVIVMLKLKVKQIRETS